MAVVCSCMRWLCEFEVVFINRGAHQSLTASRKVCASAKGYSRAFQNIQYCALSLVVALGWFKLSIPSQSLPHVDQTSTQGSLQHHLLLYANFNMRNRRAELAFLESQLHSTVGQLHAISIIPLTAAMESAIVRIDIKDIQQRLVSLERTVVGLHDNVLRLRASMDAESRMLSVVYKDLLVRKAR